MDQKPKHKPILYSFDLSPGVRSVRLVAAAIGLELDVSPVDLFHGEHLREPLIQMNPQHTIPILDDNGNILADSHAISTYLVGKYAKDDSLYPSDLYQRARVDQRLHFNSSVIWPRLLNCTQFIQIGGIDVPQDRIDRLYDTFDILEAFLQDELYLVNNRVTVADLCLITTVSTMLYFAPITTEKYPKLVDWIALVAELPYYEEISGRLVPVTHEYIDKRRAENRKQNC